MSDVNERIVETYLRIVRKWFYMTDIPFEVPRNYSNIDLLAFDPQSKRGYDIEVKYRSEWSLTNKQSEIDWLIDEVLLGYHKERVAKLEEIVGKKNTGSLIRVLVTTRKMFGTSKDKHNKMLKMLQTSWKRKKQQDLEVWYFDDMIPELVKHINVKGGYRSEVVQIIRMMKRYSDATEE